MMNLYYDIDQFAKTNVKDGGVFSKNTGEQLRNSSALRSLQIDLDFSRGNGRLGLCGVPWKGAGN